MTTVNILSPDAGRTEGTWFGQPRGLTVLFLTNMWEQFSYFGMRALLVYYMTKQLAVRPDTASSIFGWYTACAYFTPIFGGVLADRYLGKRRAIIIGGSVMALGHFMMTFEPLLYPALATIAVGNGLFLPSLPAQVGDLYEAGDPRRAWAYNVYYVGINIGGFLAPLICGFVGERYGWHYGFGIAGLGMLGGLVIYLAGGKYLPPETARRSASGQPAARGRFSRETVLVLLGIALAVTVFRAAYEQVGNTVAQYIDTGIERGVGGFVIPATWFQSLNPLFVMLMTPPLLAYWSRRAAAGADQSPAKRMATGALIVAAAYLGLAALAYFDAGHRASWAWLVLFFAMYTFGELFVLPTGLGLFARLAPLNLGTATVGAWYLISSTGNLSAGKVGRLWSHTTPPVFFCVLAALAALSALLLRAASGRTERLERDRVTKRV